MNIITKKLSELKESPYNPRTISSFMFDKLKESIKKYGYIEPIIVNKRTGYVVGGNQRLKALRELYDEDEEVFIIEIDIDENDEKSLNIALNKISGDWDFNKLEEIFKELPEEYIDITGFDEDELKNLNFEEDSLELEKESPYTKKIKAPIYEIKGEKPKIYELYNISDYQRLIDLIEKSNIDYETKKFLKFAASRFIVFNYSKIAEFYAHSNKEVQKLMEELALVIIDFNRAIEKGFIKMSEDLIKLYTEEEDD